MKSYITIKEAIACHDYISIHFDCSDNLRKYFVTDTFYATYDGIELDNLPYSVLTIPFITNVLPLCWFTNSKLLVKEVDETLLKSLRDVKYGMSEMYPHLSYPRDGVGIVFDKVVSNIVKGDGAVSLFTGGADAFATLLSHIDEKPILTIIRGTERVHKMDNVWNNVRTLIESNAQSFGLERVIITSNLRWMFNLRMLDVFLDDQSESYWYSYQHGLALTGHLAPIAYVKGCSHAYISATFSEKDKGIIPCGSDPTIEGRLIFMGIPVIHDLYDKNRQEKLKLISDYQKANEVQLNMRVCYSNQSGTNCCKCEKCSRTIIGIMAENSKPEDFGFKSDHDTICLIRDNILNNWLMNKHTKAYWKEIQQRYTNNISRETSMPEMLWFYDFDFNKVNFRLSKVFKLMVQNMKDYLKTFMLKLPYIRLIITSKYF